MGEKDKETDGRWMGGTRNAACRTATQLVTYLSIKQMIDQSVNESINESMNQSQYIYTRPQDVKQISGN